jgi:DnaJ-class molecular chaperone
MEEIGKKIKGNISDAKDKARSIRNLLREVEDVLKTSKIKCSSCGGRGEVAVQSYQREEGIVQPYMQIKRCYACNGKGYFDVSRTVTQLASQLTDGLKELTRKEVSAVNMS